MTTDTQIDTLIELSHQFGTDEEALCDNYSGRFMYGAKCYGIFTDDPEQLIEAAAEAGIKGARIDRVGMSTIVYWSRIRKSENTELV